MQLCLWLASAVAPAASAAACPAGFTLMASTANFTACEDHRKRDGSLIFMDGAGRQLGEPIPKSAAAMYTTANNSYTPPPDTVDPTLEGVMAEKQPMVHVGALDKNDPKNCAGAKPGCKVWHPQSASGWDVHTFVGSRGSSVKSSFDSLGSDVNGMGYPDMNQWPVSTATVCHRTVA